MCVDSAAWRVVPPCGVYLLYDGPVVDCAVVGAQELHEAMHGSFGCVHDTMDEFSSAAMSVFGSGYAWLAVDREGTLLVETTANQVRVSRRRR